MAPIPNALVVFLTFAPITLLMFAPFFAFAFASSKYSGSARGYALAWLWTSLGVAAALTLMQLAQDLTG